MKSAKGPDANSNWNFEEPEKILQIEKNTQNVIDQKLEEFLRLNSENLSSRVQHYFDKSDNPKYISLDEKLEGLCLVAWERKEFLNKILKM